MSDGKWSGRAANRSRARPGRRHASDRMTSAGRHELYEAMAAASFWCEACGGHHPLIEHQACRTAGRY